jgi:hypothetical protein
MLEKKILETKIPKNLIFVKSLKLYLQHMQQCQVILSRYYGNMIDPKEWDMLMVSSAVPGFEPTIS